MWRISLFNKENLVSLNKSTFYSSQNLDIKTFKFKIVIVGLFIDFKNNIPSTNLQAFFDFINYANKISDYFPEGAIIIRMKILSKKEKKFI